MITLDDLCYFKLEPCTWHNHSEDANKGSPGNRFLWKGHHGNFNVVGHNEWVKFQEARSTEIGISRVKQRPACWKLLDILRIESSPSLDVNRQSLIEADGFLLIYFWGGSTSSYSLSAWCPYYNWVFYSIYSLWYMSAEHLAPRNQCLWALLWYRWPVSSVLLYVWSRVGVCYSSLEQHDIPFLICFKDRGWGRMK